MPDSISFPVLQSWKVLSNAQFPSHLTIITTQVKKRILLICTFFRLSSNGLVMEDEMTLDGAIISASFDEALETVSFILFLHLLLISCHCNHYYMNRINGIHVVLFLKGHYWYIIRYIMVCQLGWKNQYQVGQWPCTEGEYCFFEGFIGSPTLNVDHSFFLIVWFTIAKLTSLMV